MKYKYEAVSGNQDVFKHNESGKAHTASISSDGKLTFWITGCPKTDVVIAERKVKEVKLPVVGDVATYFNCQRKYKVVYVSKSDVVLEMEDGSCLSMTHFVFNDNYTIIDQSKQPNPVNMVEEKWFP